MTKSNKTRIKAIHLPLYAIYLVLFKIYAVPQSFQQAYKVLLLACVLLYLIFHMSIRKLLNESLLFGGLVIVSSIFGFIFGSITIQSVFNSVLYALCLYALFALIQLCHEKGCMTDMLNCFLRITAIFCLISFVSILMNGTSNEGTTVEYFFGNKFATSYYFIFFTCLFYMRYVKKIEKHLRWKVVYLVLALIAVLVSNWVYCSTAVLSGLILLIIPLLPSWLRSRIASPSTALICVVVAAIIPFLIVQILEIKFVQYVIVEVLGESLMLTGRKHIYSKLGEVIGGSPLFGYGYSNVAVAEAATFGNAQNGLLQYIVDYGLIGTAVFVWLVYRCMKSASREPQNVGMYMLAYAMILASVVEISYNYVFFVAIFILRWSYTRKGNGTRHIRRR